MKKQNKNTAQKLLDLTLKEMFAQRTEYMKHFRSSDNPKQQLTGEEVKGIVFDECADYQKFKDAIEFVDKSIADLILGHTPEFLKKENHEYQAFKMLPKKHNKFWTYKAGEKNEKETKDN